MYTGLDASSRTLVWQAAQNDSGCYLTAAEAKALWGTIQKGSVDRLHAVNDLAAEHEKRAAAEQSLRFANDTADILLEQVREQQLRIGTLERELAQEAQAVGVLTTALMNGGDELERAEAQYDRAATMLAACRRELALADLRLAERDYELGIIDKWELDAAADHARKYEDDLTKRYRREQA